jgi:nucleoid DNA-binding protein
MTKADLVEQVHEAIGPGVTKKDCAAVVDAFLNAVKKAIADGEHIEIRGFGTFKVRHRKPRVARNPRTGDSVMVPARAVPIFKPSRLFKKEVEESL